MGISIGDIKNISQKSSQSIHDFWHVKWRNSWWWWDAPRCLIGLDSWLLALDTTSPWFFAKSGIFFYTIYVKHLIHANLFSGLFYSAESLADIQPSHIQSKNIQPRDIQPSQSLVIFRMCALPPSGPDRAKRQQSNLITPEMVGTKIRIESIMLNCTHLLECVPSPLQGLTGPKDNNQTW